MKRMVAVTGAFGALGSVVVSHLTSSGYRVAAIDLGPSGVAPDGALTIGGVDLAEPAAAGQAFDRVRAEGQPLAGLVNIAGGFVWDRVADGDIDAWDQMYRINLRTAVNACKAAIPLMVPGSSIVNIGAMGALNPGVGMAAYAASKSGVARLTESLAAELKEQQIRVNAILPSIIDTPANRRDMAAADFGAWVAPQELAEIIAFFLSNAARSITGASLPVAGR